MAAVFKVSQSEWVKRGFSDTDYIALLNNGYQVIWTEGGGAWTLRDKDGITYGKATAKSQSGGYAVAPDVLFAAKFKDVTGNVFVQGFVNKTKNSPSKSPQPKQSLADALMSHHSNAQQPPASPDLNLTTVTDVGVAIPGTSSTYTSYMISDDCNIAYRWTGKGLSIRAEKFTPAAAKALEEWGLDLKKGKRPYASTHLQITDKKLVPRTLGSLAACVLTGAPDKILAKEKI